MCIVDGKTEKFSQVIHTLIVLQLFAIMVYLLPSLALALLADVLLLKETVAKLFLLKLWILDLISAQCTRRSTFLSIKYFMER